jgi:tape measure domain-containing protein
MAAEEKLSWFFELIDRFSGPAGQIGKSLEKLGTKVPAASTAWSRFVKGFSGVRPRDETGRFLKYKLFSIEGFASRLRELPKSIIGSFKGIGSAIFSIPGLIGGGLAALGTKFVADTLSFKENSLVAFKTMLGSEQAAGRVFQQAVDFAAKTPFDTKDVITAFQKLLTAGFKESELDTVMRALGDVGASNGVEAMQSAQRAIGQIMAKGRLQGEELMQLSEAGIGMGAVYDQLAKAMGKSRYEVQKLITAGKVDAGTGVFAILEAINQTKSGGKGVGSLMQAQANTLTGVMSTLASRPSELLMAAQAGGAMDPFKKAITGLTDLLDPASPMGKRIVAFIERIGNAFGRMFGAATEGNMLERVLGGIMSFLEGIVTVAGTFFDAFGPAFSAALGPTNGLFGSMQGGTSIVADLSVILKALAIVLGTVVGITARAIMLAVGLSTAFLGLAASITSMLTPTLEWFSGLYVKAWQWGSDLIAGFVAGILGAVTKVTEAVHTVGSTAVTSLKGVLGIASPSRVFMGLGEETGAGFALGLQRSDMQGALDASMPIGPTASLANMSGLGSSSTTTNAPVFNLQVDAKGASKEDAASIAETIRQVLLSEMTGAFEQMAIEVGA